MFIHRLNVLHRSPDIHDVAPASGREFTDPTMDDDDDDEPQGNGGNGNGNDDEPQNNMPSGIESAAPGPALGEDGNKAVIDAAKAGITADPAAPASGTPASGGSLSELNALAESVMGLPGGLITFDTGEKVPFGELDAEERAAVTAQWKATLPTAAEKAVLAQIRAAGSPEAYVAQQASRTPQAATGFSDDDLHRAAIRRELGDADDAEVEAELAHRKQSPRHERATTALRGQAQEAAVAAQDAEVYEERVLFSTVMNETPHFANFALNDEHKEMILKDVLEPDDTDPSVSRFIKKFDDPAFVLRMAFFDKFGEGIIRSMAKRLPAEEEQTDQPASRKPQRGNPVSTGGRRAFIDVTQD